MSRLCFFILIALGSLSLRADDYFFELDDESERAFLEAQNEEEELTNSLGAIEMDEFDSEGISLFGMDLDEGEKILFPWGGREDFSAFIEERAHEALSEVSEIFSGEESSESIATPTKEAVPSRSNRLLSTRPRVVPSRVVPSKEKSSELQSGQKKNSQKNR